MNKIKKNFFCQFWRWVAINLFWFTITCAPEAAKWLIVKSIHIHKCCAINGHLLSIISLQLITQLFKKLQIFNITYCSHLRLTNMMRYWHSQMLQIMIEILSLQIWSCVLSLFTHTKFEVNSCDYQYHTSDICYLHFSASGMTIPKMLVLKIIFFWEYS